MRVSLGRLIVIVVFALAIIVLYSSNKVSFAGGKKEDNGTTWASGHDDDGSSGGKKKKKPKKHWQTKGNKNIDPGKHFLGTTDEADLVIKTDNVEKMRVTTEGDVGIGTDSPTGTLHVEGGSADGITDGKDITIDAQDGGPTGGAGGDILLLPGASGDGFAPAGKVGIGTDTPTLTLDVNGRIRIRGGSPFVGGVLTSDSDGRATWQSVNDADADPTNELQTLSQAGNNVTLSNGGGTVTVADNDNDSSNELQTLSQAGNNVTLSNGGGIVSVDDGDSVATNELQTLSISGTDLSLSNGGGTVSIADNDNDSTNELNTGISFDGTSLTITDAGGDQTVNLDGLINGLDATDDSWIQGGGGVITNDNVFIVSNAPGSFRLNVLGATNGGSFQVVDLAAGASKQLLGIWASNNAGPQVRYLRAGIGFIDIGQDATGNFVVESNDIPRLTVETSGDVGIGTTNPGEKLEVAGNIKVTGGSFIDDGTTLTVPDYVFEDEYRLMPLDELREFVNREKHLPNVPSVNDINESGVNISQFQMRLLEKIEELTLHTLSQQEEIEQLEAENDTAKKEDKQLREKLTALADRQEALEEIFLAISTTFPKDKLVKHNQAGLDEAQKTIQ